MTNMIYIRATDGTIGIISQIPISNYTCILESLPEDFYYYLKYGKYLAYSDGLQIADGWKDFSDAKKERIELGIEVPQSITPRQGMLLLSRRGQLAMVEQTIYNLELITGDKQLAEEALIEWNKASSWDRQNNTVQFIADLLMWSEEDKDDFFIEADKIK